MKTLQLFREGKEIIASDGILYVDGRLNSRSIETEVIKRNERFVNFPHKVCDSFAIYSNGIGSKLSDKVKIKEIKIGDSVLLTNKTSHDHFYKNNLKFKVIDIIDEPYNYVLSRIEFGKDWVQFFKRSELK